jgi:hypothetical protein
MGYLKSIHSNISKPKIHPIYLHRKPTAPLFKKEKENQSIRPV